VAVITGDVPLGASRDEALAAIPPGPASANDVSLRNLIPGELAKSFRLLPVEGPRVRLLRRWAITPDALPNFKDGKLHGKLEVELKRRRRWARPTPAST